MAKWKQVLILSSIILIPILMGGGLFAWFKISATRHAALWQGVDISDWAPLESAEELARGARIYRQSCQTCHGVDGVGIIGPPLTDPKWRDSLGFPAMVNIVLSGVEKTPMPAWKGSMEPESLHVVESFAWSLSAPAE